VLAAASTSAGDLFVKVLPLAIGAAVSPTTLVVVLLILGGRVHPRARGAAFVAGFVAVLAVLTAVSLTVLARSVTHRAGDDSLYAWIDLGFGALLVALGVRALLRTPKPKPPRVDSTDPGAHLVRFFGFGVGLMLTNFSTIVLYIPAMKDVAIASVGFGTKAAVVAIVLAFAASPAWVPVLLDSVAPTSAGRVLGRLNDFLARHQKAVSVTVCFVFAAYLVVKGVRAL
jgi:hypothetical protein